MTFAPQSSAAGLDEGSHCARQGSVNIDRTRNYRWDSIGWDKCRCGAECCEVAIARFLIALAGLRATASSQPVVAFVCSPRRSTSPLVLAGQKSGFKEVDEAFGSPAS